MIGFKNKICYVKMSFKKLPSQERMKKFLDGMFWDSGEEFELPNIGDPIKASRLFLSNLTPFTWNSLSTLEDNPATLPQTATILAGQSVGGLSIDDLMQVKHFSDGSKLLAKLIRDNNFKLDIDTACMIHSYVGKEEALDWGVLRYSNVTIQGTEYLPPNPKELPALMKSGFAFIAEEIGNPIERAIAVFLFMSRSQFFFDANKRTSTLMMNGILLSNGYYPLTVLKKDAEQFYAKLSRFYESGNATDMFAYFANLAKTTYRGR